MDADRQTLLDSFAAETAEALQSFEESLLSLESGSAAESEEALRTIFRVAHSIKGNALCLGFDAVGEYADRLEDFLETLRDGSNSADSARVTTLLRLVDALREWIPDAISGDESVPAECERLLAALNQPASEADATNQSMQRDSAREQGKTLRIDVAKLDRLLNLTTEMIAVHARVTAMAAQPSGDAASALLDSLDDAGQLTSELQDLVMRARMVPIGPLFRQYARVIRDTGRELGKSAELVIDGGDVELDLASIEALRDPLTHIVRNALDHGLETPADRIAAGKPASGTISFSARHDGGNIVVRISDDGRGLDEERIRARAIERGILSADRKLSTAEMHNLIFEPGFTTTDEATAMSGRGVGMDVVKGNIERVRGEVSVDSTPGAGTHITIRLPLTIAIIDGLLVSAGGDMYVIPLDSVIECADAPQHGGRPTGVLAHRDSAVPFGRLDAFLGYPRTEVLGKAVIVRNGEGRAAIVVEDVVGREQIVVKPLDEWYCGETRFSGSTILPSGRVALIVDVRSMLQMIATGAPSRRFASSHINAATYGTTGVTA